MMDAKKLGDLKALTQTDGAVFKRELVAELIDAHERQQRAEGFWSDLAPRMSEELMILRRVETHMRAVLVTMAFAADRARVSRIELELSALDALRALHAGGEIEAAAPVAATKKKREKK